jgi:outer membrane protein TolC
MKHRLSGAALALLLGAGCMNIKPVSFDPQAIEAMQREQAAGHVRRELAGLPRSLPDLADPNVPAASTRPSLATRPAPPVARLKLQEIIHRAVAGNLDVRLASYQSAIDEQRVLEAEARFDPRFFTNYQVQTQYPQGIIANNFDPTQLRSYVMTSGFKMEGDLGTQFDLHWQTQKQDFQSRSPFSTAIDRGKSWDQQVVMQITQPLLRDFGGEVNRARIVIARNDQKISQLDTRAQLEKVLRSIEESYWRLVAAEQDVQIQEELLRNSEETLEFILKRVRDRNDVQISQARAAVEQHNFNLVRARAAVEDASDQLKRFMNDPDFPLAGPTLILPADRPVAEPVQLALADQVAVAMQNRTELLQAAIRIDSARVIIKAADNNALPRFDIVLQGGYEGIGETFNESLNSFDDGHLINWTIGFQVEVPIGNRQARAIQGRVRLQHIQTVDQWRLEAEKVLLEVRQALREVETGWGEVVAAQRSVFAAQDSLAALEKRMELDPQGLTPERVQLKLDRQAGVAQARQSLNRALAGYNLALAGLEAAKGTLLRYNAIEMREGPLAR